MKQKWLFGLGAAAGAAAAGVAVLRAREAGQIARRVRLLDRCDAANGKNIVILGAGFGGINTAAALLDRLPPETGWRITLVDRNNYFLFTPLLYHAATGLVDPSNTLYPVRALSRAANFQFREAEVESIDLKRQLVHLGDGPLPYDHLVLALGSTTNFFGQQENLKHALTLKTAGDSIAIRNRIIDAFERADATTDSEERRRCLTFVVVGGGATGIELAGAVHGLVQGTLARQYPRVSPQEARILVFEAMSRILPGIPDDLVANAATRLREKGIDLRLNAPVDAVDTGGIRLKSGEYVPSRTVVWAAGVRPSPLIESLEVPKIKGGRIQVDEFLQVQGVPNVYALGDVAAFQTSESEKPLPPAAAVAVQEARALAEILVARLEGGEPRPFRYRHRGDLVSLGRNEAVADVGGVHVSGFAAWLLWRAFYLSQLWGFKNQLSVALDWTFAYAYDRETVRLGLPCESALLAAKEEEQQPAAPRPDPREPAGVR